MRTLSIPLLVLLLGAVALVYAACDTAPGSKEGRMVVRLTDDILDEVDEAHVTITRVEAVSKDDGIVLLSDEVQPFDLVTLRDGLTATLADEMVPPGTYVQLRIVVDPDAELVLKDGSTMKLKVPSGSASGIKILLPDVVIEEASDDVDLTVDFDLSRSFIKAGNSGKYIFKPTLKPLSVLMNGEELPIPADEEEDEEEEEEEEEEDEEEDEEEEEEEEG